MECVGRTEKAVFLTGMAFIALGRATRFASSQPFPDDDHQEDRTSNSECPDRPQKQIIVFLRFALVTLFFVTPAVVFFAFPYIKKWHVLFGVSTIFTALATLSHLSTFRRHKKPGPNPSSVVGQSLGFGYKAALKFFVDRTRENGGDFRSPEARAEVRAAAVLDDELYKIKSVVIRAAVLYSTCILCGVVSSVGSTYFVEQAARMDYSIGRWRPPLQLLQLLFTVFKHLFAANAYAITSVDDVGLELSINNSMAYSVACCAVAAAVERRRVHAVRRHDILDDAKTTPMSAFWLIFQLCFLGVVEALADYSVTKFHEKEAPKWMKRYGDCLSEALTGVGYMCGALSVYVVGKISETRGGKNWFQHSLNRSRVDRYYWVLTALSAVYLSVFMVVMEVKGYRHRKSRETEA